jgi:hypothetical protein
MNAGEKTWVTTDLSTIPWVLRLVRNLCDHLLIVHLLTTRMLLLLHKNHDSHAIRRCALYQFHTRDRGYSPLCHAIQTLLLKGVVATEAMAAGQRRAGGGIVCV